MGERMSADQRSLDRLRTTNSLAELHTLAHDLKLERVMAAPLSQLAATRLLSEGAMVVVAAAAATFGKPDIHGFLADADCHRAIKKNAASEVRVEVLRAFQQFLARPSKAVTTSAPGATPQLTAVPQSVPALIKWLVERGIADVLAAPVTVLGQDAAVSRTVAYGRTPSLSDVLGVEPEFHYGYVGLSKKERNRLAPLARAYLAEEATRTAQTLAEEPDPQRPVVGEAFKPFVAALSGLRGRLREQRIAPTPKATRARGRLSFADEPPVITYRDPRGVVVDWMARTPTVALHVAGWAEGQFEALCDCEEGREEPCRHVLAALDACWDALAAEQSPIAQQLRTFLETPGWGRTLVRLAKIAKAPPPVQAPTMQRLSWRLERSRSGPGLKLKPVAQKPAKHGGWTKGGPIRVDEVAADAGRQFTVADRRCASVLAGRAGQGDAGLWAALACLVGAPNVQLEDDPTPIMISEGDLALACEQREGDGFVIGFRAGEGRLVPGELLTRLQMSAPRFLLLDQPEHCLTLVRATDCLLEVVEALKDRPCVFPPDAATELRAELQRLNVPLSLPERLLGRKVDADSRPVVFCTLEGPVLSVAVHVRPLAAGLTFAVGEGPAQVREDDSGVARFCERQFARERTEAAQLFERLGLPPAEADGGHRHDAEGQQAPALLRLLEREAAGGMEVLWPSVRPRILRAIAAKDLTVDVRSSKDWFGLSGGATIDGERVELAALLDAARQRQRFVALSQGTYAELSDRLLEQLTPLADLSVVKEGVNSVGIGAVPVLEQLSAEVAQLSGAEAITGLIQRLRKATSAEVPLPDGLSVTLRPYQVEGFQYLARLSQWAPGAVLADDMGLGKTLQALVLLQSRASLGPALVVAPTSVCANWSTEAARFAPGLKLHLWHRCEREAVLHGMGPADVIVVSYGLLIRDCEALSRAHFATAVFDEAQAMKNPASRRAKAARGLDVDFKVALTGTPLENHLGELWSLYRSVFPALLGSEEQFRSRFWLPIERQKDASRRRALSTILRPFLMRRTKAEVAKELPPKVEVTVPVLLTAPERALYEEARLAAIAELQQRPSAGGPADKRFAILAALTRLRQLACHPRLHDPTWSGPASKLERTVELLEQLRDGGQRALVFSQFTRHLQLVKDALIRRGFRLLYLDGETPEADRQRRVESFQRGEAEIFLISLKAGGVGLNLTAADNVLHLDPWWNPAVEDQATDRAHRIGQSKTVTVYRLVTQGTVEEQILALHADKRALVAGILSEGAELPARFDADELTAILQQAANPELGELADG